MQAPIVGFPGGSRASIWPCAARRSFRSRTRIPASTIAVRSPASCSSTWSSLRVDTTTSPPSRSIETRSPRAAAPVSASAASWTVEISETFGKAGFLDRVGTVRPGHLSAQPRGGKHLARVADAVWVERPAQALHHREVVGAEEQRHRARLVDTDAVLARQRAARVDARLEDRLGERASALGLALGPCVVEDERVEIAVAGVEDVADPQAVLDLELGDPAQDLGQLRARDDAVLDVVVARDAAHRRERRLPSLPEQRPLVVVRGRPDLPGAGPGADRLDGGQILLHLR